MLPPRIEVRNHFLRRRHVSYSAKTQRIIYSEAWGREGGVLRGEDKGFFGPHSDLVRDFCYGTRKLSLLKIEPLFVSRVTTRRWIFWLFLLLLRRGNVGYRSINGLRLRFGEPELLFSDVCSSIQRQRGNRVSDGPGEGTNRSGGGGKPMNVSLFSRIIINTLDRYRYMLYKKIIVYINITINHVILIRY